MSGPWLSEVLHPIEQPAVAEDLPRDDQPVDLARALVDLGDARVAEVALDRVLLGVAVAAVDLERLASSPAAPSRRRRAWRSPLPSSSARRRLRLRPWRRRPGGSGGAPRRRRSPCRRGRSGWPGSRRSGCRRPCAPSRTTTAASKASCRDADGLRGDPDAAAVERRHRDLEAVALLAEPVVDRHPHVGQEDLDRARGVDAELDLVAGAVEAGRCRRRRGTPRSRATFFSGFVIAKRRQTSAACPHVMKTFWPEIR